MNIEVLPVNEVTLGEYSKIPISFEVASKLDIELLENGLSGMAFHEVKLVPPYTKDYDAGRIEHTRWDKRFDVSNWALFMMRDGQTPVGGAVVAFRSANVDMLERREDLAVLWDLRVHPEQRHSGIGTGLFAAAVEWAREKGCTQLRVETQNVNVPACRFYVKQGCRLGEVHRFKYINDPGSAHEAALIWYLDLR